MELKIKPTDKIETIEGQPCRKINRGYSTKYLPLWAQRFAFLIDGEASYDITAHRALEILERT